MKNISYMTLLKQTYTKLIHESWCNEYLMIERNVRIDEFSLIYYDIFSTSNSNRKRIQLKRCPHKIWSGMDFVFFFQFILLSLKNMFICSSARARNEMSEEWCACVCLCVEPPWHKQRCAWLWWHCEQTLIQKRDCLVKPLTMLNNWS